MLVLLTSAILLGLGGSLHCLGMCGPLVLRLHQETSSLFWSLIYHFSRAFTYGIFGLLFGLIGKGLQLMNIQQYLSILAGVVMLIFLFRPYLNTFQKPTLFQKITSQYYAKVLQLPSAIKYPALGVLNALLPCGLIYTALATSAVTAQTAAQGFLFLFIFGLGTIPVLLILHFVGKAFQISKSHSTKFILNAFTFTVAILLILRGLNLGIPYISPKQNTQTHQVENCCHPE